MFVIFLYFLLKKMRMFARYNPTFNFFIIALLLRVSTEDGLLFDFFDFTLWMFFFVNINNLSQNLVNTNASVTRQIYHYEINR